MDDLNFERDFWGNCANTFTEELKQLVYAKYMGLEQCSPGFLNVNNKRILDIGGGPVSLLLKAYNLAEGKVCDPIDYPQWTKDRYKAHNISVEVINGEDVNEAGWDEVWIYNVMQHCIDPEKIVNNAIRSANALRIFEWVNKPPYKGHPHMLTRSNLEKWIGQTGNVCELTGEGECYGECFYGSFNMRKD